MDGGDWWDAVHEVEKSQTRLSDFTFTFYFHALEKEMATHSSVLAWRIPGTGSLVGCRLWGRTESDRLKRLSSSSSSCLEFKSQILLYKLERVMIEPQNMSKNAREDYSLRAHYDSTVREDYK